MFKRISKFSDQTFQGFDKWNRCRIKFSQAVSTTTTTENNSSFESYLTSNYVRNITTVKVYVLFFFVLQLSLKRHPLLETHRVDIMLLLLRFGIAHLSDSSFSFTSPRDKVHSSRSSRPYSRERNSSYDRYSSRDHSYSRDRERSLSRDRSRDRSWSDRLSSARDRSLDRPSSGNRSKLSDRSNNFRPRSRTPSPCPAGRLHGDRQLIHQYSIGTLK